MDSEDQEEAAFGDVGMRGSLTIDVGAGDSLTVHLASQGMKAQRGLEKVQEASGQTP